MSIARGHLGLGYRVGEGSDPKSLYVEPLFWSTSRFRVFNKFYYQSGDTLWGHPPRRNRWLEIPLSFLFFLVTLPTAFFWRSYRFEPWQCRDCRYDLRGLEGGGEKAVCPECGLAKGEG